MANKKMYLFDEGSPSGHTDFDHLHEVTEKDLSAWGIPITESVQRNSGSNHGSVVTESNRDLAKEVARFVRSYGVTHVEALLMAEGGRRIETYGLSEKQLRESWKPYAEILTETEIDGLVRGRVAAPRKG